MTLPRSMLSKLERPRAARKEEPQVVQAVAPTPIINVQVPEQPAPVVNLTTEPKVILNPSKPVVYETIIVERDHDGLVKRMIHRPVEV